MMERKKELRGNPGAPQRCGRRSSVNISSSCNWARTMENGVSVLGLRAHSLLRVAHNCDAMDRSDPHLACCCRAGLRDSVSPERRRARERVARTLLAVDGRARRVEPTLRTRAAPGARGNGAPKGRQARRRFYL